MTSNTESAYHWSQYFCACSENYTSADLETKISPFGANQTLNCILSHSI